MKNTAKYMLINTIAMPLFAFRDLISELTHGIKTVEYEFGAYITDTDDNILNEYDDINAVLSKYFDVCVTSWHSDTCETPMVFICYVDSIDYNTIYSDENYD